MANFKTHLNVALIGSTVVAGVAIFYQLINEIEFIWLVFLGTIGGLLPDIDSHNTKQVRVLFLLLAIASSVSLLSDPFLSQQLTQLLPTTTLICHANSLKIAPLLNDLSHYCFPYAAILIALSSFLFVRYLLFKVFNSLTVHRGIFHSLLAASFFALIIACISFQFLKQNATFSWISGAFIAIGFIIHLLLDEVYSVDIANKRLKRSFGTALKLYGYRSPIESILMIFCMFYLSSFAPKISPFLKLFT